MVQVPSLMWVEEVYPKDLGYVIRVLLEAVEELQEKIEALEKRETPCPGM